MHRSSLTASSCQERATDFDLKLLDFDCCIWDEADCRMRHCAFGFLRRVPARWDSTGRGASSLTAGRRGSRCSPSGKPAAFETGFEHGPPAVLCCLRAQIGRLGCCCSAHEQGAGRCRAMKCSSSGALRGSCSSLLFDFWLLLLRFSAG